MQLCCCVTATSGAESFQLQQATLPHKKMKITTSTGFTIEILVPFHRMSDHPLSDHNGKEIRKITAPDGSSRLQLNGENFIIWDGFSDEAHELIDDMTGAQFAELTA